MCLQRKVISENKDLHEQLFSTTWKQLGEDYGTTSTLQCESLFYLKFYSLPKSCSSRCALDFFFSLLLDQARLAPCEKSFFGHLHHYSHLLFRVYSIIDSMFTFSHQWRLLILWWLIDNGAFSCFYQKSPSPDDPCTMYYVWISLPGAVVSPLLLLESPSSKRGAEFHSLAAS